MIDSLENPPN